MQGKKYRNNPLALFQVIFLIHIRNPVCLQTWPEEVI